jgi:hypothetical protein
MADPVDNSAPEHIQDSAPEHIQDSAVDDAPAPKVSSSRVRRAFAWCVAQTSAREDGAAMALMRIAVGLSTLILVVPFAFTEAGQEIVRFSFCDDDAGGFRGMVGSPGIRLFGGPVPEVFFGLFVVSIVCAVLMVVGLFGRVPILVAAVATNIALGQNTDVSGGGDALLGNALFLLLLSNCTQTLSLDCVWRTGRFVDPTPVAAWPRKLALVQLAIIYTTTGLQKLVSTAWTPLDGFSALYQILQSPQWSRFPRLVEAADGWLVGPLVAMTAITIVWECGFFVVLLKPRWRAAMAVIGVGLHTGILLSMEVGIFSWLSMAMYPTMFGAASARLAARMTKTPSHDAAST